MRTPGDKLNCSRLLLEASRACWDGVDVTLTVGEFKVVHLLASRAGECVPYRQIYDAMHYAGFVAGSGEHGYRVEPDSTIHQVNPADYDLLLIPDGVCGERLRVREEAVDVARTFMQEGSRVAAIGHGQQLLLSAGALDGRRVTCSPGIRDDVRAAGASYRDEAVVIHGNLITCRGADDLPAFALAMIRMLETVKA